MKKKLFLSLLMVASLAACATGQIHYGTDDYKSVIHTAKKQNEGFRIVCFNDLHYGVLANLETEYQYLDKLLSYNGSPDLIVLNGDVFHNATKEIVIRTLDYFDSKGIPFTYTYGNHDLEGQFDSQFINRELLKRKNCLLKNPHNDDVYGDSNYFINIHSESQLFWQIHFLDTNNYQLGTYDYIHQDQIDWYRRVVEETTQNEGKVIPSLTFMHIPFKEFEYAWANYGYAKHTTADAKNGDAWTMLDTGVASPSEDCNTFEIMKELGSAKGVVVAHDHINNSDFNYEGIRLIYGTKTGHCLYYNELMMGASYYTLGIDQNGDINPNSFKNERVNLLYSDDVPVDNTDLHMIKGGK